MNQSLTQNEAQFLIAVIDEAMASTGGDFCFLDEVQGFDKRSHGGTVASLMKKKLVAFDEEYDYQSYWLEGLPKLLGLPDGAPFDGSVIPENYAEIINRSAK